MSNNGSSQTATAVETALRGEPVFKDVRWASTGDAVSDCMAGIRAVCDDSLLSARQVQYIMECYAKLYKDAADDNDRRIADDAQIWGKKFEEVAHKHPLQHQEPVYTATSTKPPFDNAAMWKHFRDELEKIKAYRPHWSTGKCPGEE